MPSRPEQTSDPAEDPLNADDEEVVDLLSISSLATSEPELPLEPPAAAPPPEPVRPAAAPQAPPQAVAPQPVVEQPPPQPPIETPEPPTASPAEDPVETAFDTAVDPAADTAAFDPARQGQLSNLGLSRLSQQSEFDETATFRPGLLAWDFAVASGALSNPNCYFSEVTSTDFRLREAALDLKYMTRNLALVERDLMSTFSGQTVTEVPGGYCGGSLYEVSENGQPLLWVSFTGVGEGDIPANVIVVFWQSLPTL